MESLFKFHVGFVQTYFSFKSECNFPEDFILFFLKRAHILKAFPLAQVLELDASSAQLSRLVALNSRLMPAAICITLTYNSQAYGRPDADSTRTGVFRDIFLLCVIEPMEKYHKVE